MPRATISIEPQRFDLKTLEDGYVLLRRMPFGDWLHRQEIAMEMTIESQGRGKGAGMKGEVNMAQQAVAIYEFQRCIADHNLLEDNDEPMDFRNPTVFSRLDPKIGNEISEYIRGLHEFGTDDDGGNS